MGNLALSALVLFSLLTPGLIAAYRYHASAAQWESSGNVTLTIDRTLTWGLLVSLPVHLIWQILVNVGDSIFAWGKVDYGLLFTLTSDPSDAALRDLGDQISDGLLFSLFLYLSTQVAACWYLGEELAQVAERSGWNATVALRSPGAFWHRVFMYPEEEPDLIIVSVAITMGSENYLYHGLLHEYQLTPDGDLHRVVLEGASRRLLHANEEGLDKSVPGEYLSLNCDTAQSLNVDYLWESHG